jgi:hypothetical protein
MLVFVDCLSLIFGYTDFGDYGFCTLAGSDAFASLQLKLKACLIMIFGGLPFSKKVKGLIKNFKYETRKNSIHLYVMLEYLFNLKSKKHRPKNIIKRKGFFRARNIQIISNHLDLLYLQG